MASTRTGETPRVYRRPPDSELTHRVFCRTDGLHVVVDLAYARPVLQYQGSTTAPRARFTSRWTMRSTERRERASGSRTDQELLMPETTRWLVYLRYDSAGVVETYHVGATVKGGAQLIVNRARRRGLTPEARLVEYAVFSSLRNIHPREAPNFHYISEAEFFGRTGGPATAGDGAAMAVAP